MNNIYDKQLSYIKCIPVIHLCNPTLIIISNNLLNSYKLLLKQQINKLEEQKKIQEENELKKKENPLNKLKDIIDEKKKYVETINYSRKGAHAEGFNVRDKIKFLEPIFYMLKDINVRLEVIEKKN